LSTIGLFGVVALTKTDLVDNKLVNNPSSIYTSTDMNRYCGIVGEKTGFSPRQVFPLKLYHHERERSNIIECLSLEVLAEVAQQVTSHIHQGFIVVHLMSVILVGLDDDRPSDSIVN
jgi:hypothetical protein